jgi:hypothetical protein
MELIKFRKNIYSQFGEDGILEQTFKKIKGNKWCLEFGAWDGKHFSNTHNLIKNKGWKGVLIEPNSARFKDLCSTYQDNKKVTCLKRFVSFQGRDSLDNILKETKIPLELDLLSIDIDGNDYHVWKFLKKYSPRIVVIEFNPTIPHDVEFVQTKDFGVNQGTSLLYLMKLGKEKGYELIAATDTNAFFVRKIFYPFFNIKNNSPSVLHNNSKYETKFFQLYDGTIVLKGCKKLLWHGVKIDNETIQVLPKFLRKFPGKSVIFLTRIYQGYFRNLLKII